MDCFFPVKTAVKTATVEDMVAPIIDFRCANAFNGKRSKEAFNQAQKPTSSLVHGGGETFFACGNHYPKTHLLAPNAGHSVVGYGPGPWVLMWSVYWRC